MEFSVARHHHKSKGKTMFIRTHTLRGKTIKQINRDAGMTLVDKNQNYLKCFLNFLKLGELIKLTP